MDVAFAPGDVNWLAVLTAALSSVLLGAVWYGPLFGRRWAVEMDLDGLSDEARQAQLPRAMLLMVVGAALQAAALRFVLAFAVPVFDSPGGEPLTWTVAFVLGVVVWLGTFVPVQLGRVAWEGRSWHLFCINAAFYLLSLLVMTAVLGSWA